MSKRTCSIDGCGRPHFGRGWCNKHWQRWRAHGDPRVAEERYYSAEESFEARTMWDESGCLVWTASNNGVGYGKIYVGGRKDLAHRYAWERKNGPIPKGLLVDHICHKPSCVNIEHLRLVTQTQNAWNALMPRRDGGMPRNVERHGPSYRVVISRNGTRHRFGPYATSEEAGRVANLKRAELFGEYAPTGGGVA